MLKAQTKKIINLILAATLVSSQLAYADSLNNCPLLFSFESGDVASAYQRRSEITREFEKISKTETRKGVAKAIETALELAGTSHQKKDESAKRVSKFNSYARELLINRFMGWTAARSNHEVPFYYIADGTFQRIEILAGVVKGTLRFPTPTQENYEKDILGYRKAFEEIGKWVGEFRIYDKLLTREFAEYIRLQLEYNILNAQRARAEKHPNAPLIVALPVEITKDGQIDYIDRRILGLSELNQRQTKIRMTYPGIEKLSLKEYISQNLFKFNSPEMVGTLGQVRLRHAEVQEKLNLVLRQLLDLSVGYKFDFARVAKALRECNVSDFYLKELEILFKWVAENSETIFSNTGDKDYEDRVPRFLLDTKLDADIAALVAFNSKVFNAQLSFVFGSDIEFSEDVKHLNLLIPLERKILVDVKGGWLRQKITKIKTALLYTAGLGSLMGMAVYTYGVDMAKYAEKLQITGHLMMPAIEKKLTHVDTREQLLKNLAYYAENRYPGDQATFAQKAIARIRMALENWDNPEKAFKEIGKVEDEVLARELQHLLALHYQYLGIKERQDILKVVSANILIPAERPTLMETEIFQVAAEKDPGNYETRMINLIRHYLIENMTPERESQIRAWLTSSVPITITPAFLMDIRYNTALVEVGGVFAKNYRTEIDPANLLVGYLNYIRGLRAEILQIQKSNSPTDAQLAIADLKMKRLKDVFSFHSGEMRPTEEGGEIKFPN